MVGMHLPLALADSLSAGSMFFLTVAIGLALAFEFVNGFHDTANAVATVIYTHTLPPWIAVIWSGICNLTGVLVSSGTVAFAILALLPVELIINVGSGAGFAMIFALLISAIMWNLGTWYLGLPASSSHTLIGSILGVGLANALMTGHTAMDGINWTQVEKVFLSLLVSPLVGFFMAGALLLLLKLLIRNPELFKAPPPGQPPPWWIRGTLIFTCTGVSFAHGSNDGQKGMGLLLLILIGILPGEYALNMNSAASDVQKLQASAAMVQPMLDGHVAGASAAGALAQETEKAADASSEIGGVGTQIVGASTAGGQTDDNTAELSKYLATGGKLTNHTFAALAAANANITNVLKGTSTLSDVPSEQRSGLRKNLFLVDQTMDKLVKTHEISDAGQVKAFHDYHAQLDQATKYLPLWIKVAVAVALGLGTMIGWKRIVTTVGEKIGKEHLNYGQGASAELVAMITIGMADWFGMPVSTTHVLSSGVAGTMAANHSGLQASTMRNILMAWVLTLPVCVVLGAATFAAGLFIVFEHLVPLVTWIALAAALLLIARRLWIAASQTKNPSVSPAT
jgi:inorganic phosphate transporter, PiT family